ncbi:MAG: 50S ribosomal protein L22 [Candidatus Nealsonbacteria bacterium]|nr:50S ribosomal protein L22 [Candidatus Nealsonbacteria bacterium]
MISNAKLSYLRIAPRKVRLVADLIRGKKVEEAQVVLNFVRKRAALPILKLLNQAVANAKNEFVNIEEGDLYIAKIMVNEGPTLKRVFPRSRGRADLIQKRTSHIILELGSKSGKVEERKEPAPERGKKPEEKPGEKKGAVKERKEQTGKKVRRAPKAGKDQSIRGKGKPKIFRRKAF